MLTWSGSHMCRKSHFECLCCTSSPHDRVSTNSSYELASCFSLPLIAQLEWDNSASLNMADSVPTVFDTLESRKCLIIRFFLFTFLVFFKASHFDWLIRLFFVFKFMNIWLCKHCGDFLENLDLKNSSIQIHVSHFVFNLQYASSVHQPIWMIFNLKLLGNLLNSASGRMSFGQ